MSENLQKLIGIVVMAAIVIVGLSTTSGDDTDYTRNAAFVQLRPEEQGDLAEVSRRVEAIESALKNEELKFIAKEARDAFSEIQALLGQIQQLVGETEQRVGETEQRVSDAERRLAQAYQFARQQIDELEAEQGWVQTLDLMCQQQLSAWGRTATRADAIWDKGGPFPFGDVAGFWACRYDNLNIPELAGIQLSERVGVCLPGDQPRVTEGGRTRGQGFEAIFAESINRWVFQFNPTVEDDQFHEADFLFDAGCQ